MKKAVFLLMIPVSVEADVHVWISTTGDFADPASWSSNVGPEHWGTEDLIWFPDGNVSAEFNLDHSNVRVAELIVMERYFGAIGLPEAPLRLSADRTILSGPSYVAYEPPADERRRILISSADYLQLGGFISHLFVKAGSVDVYGGIDELVVSQGYPGTEVELYGEAAGPKRLTLSGGHVFNYRNLPDRATVIVANGFLYQGGVIGDGITLTQTGGLIRYRGMSIEMSDAVRMELLGGQFDFGVEHRLSCCGSYSVFGEFITEGSQGPLELGIIKIGADEPHTFNWTPCPDSSGVFGDLDGDHLINLADFAILQNEWSP